MVRAFVESIGSIFTKAQTRLLHVVVPAHAYGHTLALLRARGEGGAAPRPVWVLAAPSYGPSRGWPARTQELERARRAGGARSSVEAVASDPRDAFVRALAACAPEGLIVVLAPQHIDDAPAHASDVGALVVHQALAAVRWVVVDAAHSSLDDLCERLGGAAEVVVWPQVEPAELVELDRSIGDLSARGTRLPAEIDRRVAVDSPLRAPAALAVRRLLHEADQRAAAGRPGEAAALLGQAANALTDKGLLEEAALVGLERAKALLSASAPEEGQQALVSVLRDAERLGMSFLVSEVCASLGGLHLANKRFVEAAEAYTRAGQVAEERGSHAFAADMLRCAGHASLNAEMPAEALQAWGRALTLLGAPPPGLALLETPQKVVILGLTLAEAFDARGNGTAARLLRGHAEAIERRRPRETTSFS